MKKKKKSALILKIIIVIVGFVLLLLLSFFGKSIFPNLSDLHLRTIEKIIITVTIFLALFLEIKTEKSPTDNGANVRVNKVISILWLIFSGIMILKDYI